MTVPTFDLKYFISPQVLPLPVGLLMIIGGLAGGFRSDWLTFELQPINGFLMTVIGTVLTFYSLWLSRKYMSVEADFIQDLVRHEKEDHDLIRILQSRNSLSENMDAIFTVIDRNPKGISRIDLEGKLTVNEGKELSLRLSNLELRGLIVSKPYGNSYWYQVSEQYLKAKTHE